MPPSQAPAAGGDLPPGWNAVTDPTSGRVYFYNASTNQTTWERPGAAQPQPPAPVPAAPAAQPPLPRGWTEAKTPEGKVYFYNTETQATQWERPM